MKLLDAHNQRIIFFLSRLFFFFLIELFLFLFVFWFELEDRSIFITIGIRFFSLFPYGSQIFSLFQSRLSLILFKTVDENKTFGVPSQERGEREGGGIFLYLNEKEKNLISICFWLVRTINWNIDIIRLFFTHNS